MLFVEGGGGAQPSETTQDQDQQDKDGHSSSHSHSHPNQLTRSSSYNNEKSIPPSASASAQAPLNLPTSRQAYNAPRTPGDLDSDLSQFPREKDSSSSSSFQQGPSYHPLTGNNTSPAATPAGGGKKEFKDSEAYWLGLYFFFNLGLTLFNKIVLVSFPFPYVSSPSTKPHSIHRARGREAKEEGKIQRDKVRERRRAELGRRKLAPTTLLFSRASN